MPRDSGSTVGATGPSTSDASGDPAEYVVASGDNEGAICNRFGLRWWQLKYTAGKFVGTYPVLYPGQKLEIVEVARPADVTGANALC